MYLENAADVHCLLARNTMKILLLVSSLHVGESEACTANEKSGSDVSMANISLGPPSLLQGWPRLYRIVKCAGKQIKPWMREPRLM